MILVHVRKEERAHVFYRHAFAYQVVHRMPAGIHHDLPIDEQTDGIGFQPFGPPCICGQK